MLIPQAFLSTYHEPDMVFLSGVTKISKIQFLQLYVCKLYVMKKI